MRNHMKKALSLMLVLCMAASNLPYMEKAQTVHKENNNQRELLVK